MWFRLDRRPCHAYVHTGNTRRYSTRDGKRAMAGGIEKYARRVFVTEIPSAVFGTGKRDVDKTMAINKRQTAPVGPSTSRTIYIHAAGNFFPDDRTKLTGSYVRPRSCYRVHPSDVRFVSLFCLFFPEVITLTDISLPTVTRRKRRKK